MRKMLLVLGLAVLALTGVGHAETKSIYVDKGTYSGDSYRYYTYTEGSRKLTPDCWKWQDAGADSWLKMTWETGVNLAKNWTLEYDCKSANPSQVKAWSHVRQACWKKADSSMTSSISASFTKSWGTGGSFMINMQVYGKQTSDSSSWGLDLMIRPNYSGDRSYWTKVTVDGQEWYKNDNEWNSSGHFVRTVYAKKNKTNSHTIKVKPFMDHMGCKDWYVKSLEFGWEVYTGSGGWKVNSMNLKP